MSNGKQNDRSIVEQELDLDADNDGLSNETGREWDEEAQDDEPTVIDPTTEDADAGDVTTLDDPWERMVP